MSLSSLEMTNRSLTNLQSMMVLLNETNWTEWQTKKKVELDTKRVLYTIQHESDEDCIEYVEISDSDEETDDLQKLAEMEIKEMEQSKEVQEVKEPKLKTKSQKGKRKGTQETEERPQWSVLSKKQASKVEKTKKLYKRKIIKLRNDRRIAQEIIVLGLSGSFMNLVNNLIGQPYKIWRALKQHFTPKSLTTHQQLKVKFLKLKKNNNQSVDLFAADIEDLARRVNETSSNNREVIIEADMINAFLSGLPEEYKPFIDSISISKNLETDWQEIKELIKSFELKYFKNQVINNNNNNYSYLTYNKNKIKSNYNKTNNNNYNNGISRNYNNDNNRISRFPLRTPSNNNNNKRNNVVCRFFQLGKCNQGNNCRFLHPSNINNNNNSNNNNFQEKRRLCFICNSDQHLSNRCPRKLQVPNNANQKRNKINIVTTNDSNDNNTNYNNNNNNNNFTKNSNSNYYNRNNNYNNNNYNNNRNSNNNNGNVQPYNNQEDNAWDSTNMIRVYKANVIHNEKNIFVKNVQDFRGTYRKSKEVQNEKTTKWIVDTGATRSMSCNWMLMSEVRTCDPVEVHLAGGDLVIAQRVGVIYINSEVNNRKYSIRIENVLYLPQLDINLISGWELDRSGFLTTIYKGEMKINLAEEDEKIPFLVAKPYLSYANLYYVKEAGKEHYAFAIDGALPDDPTKETIQEKALKELQEWHSRFGHLNFNQVRNFVKNNTPRLSIPNKNPFCDTCYISKMTKKPSKGIPEEYQAKEIGDCIHADVVGPIDVGGEDYNKYLLHILDEFSRYVCTYIIFDKSQAKDKIKAYFEMFNTKFNRYPKVFKSDNGGEFTSTDIKEFLTSKGTLQRFTTPYVHSENNIIERFNRTHMSIVRAIMVEAGIPGTFWREVCLAATQVKNRSPHTGMDNKIPYEVWWGRKLDITKLKVIGCLGYVFIPQETRDDKHLSERSKKCIMLGYDDLSGGYRLMELQQKRVFSSTNVRFNEEVFPMRTDKSTPKISIFERRQPIIPVPYDLSLPLPDNLEYEPTPRNKRPVILELPEEDDKVESEENDDEEKRRMRASLGRRNKENAGHTPLARVSTTEFESKQASEKALEIARKTAQKEAKEAINQGLRRSGRAREPSRDVLESIANQDTKRQKVASHVHENKAANDMVHSLRVLTNKNISTQDDPTTFSDAMRSPEKKRWIEAMNTELKSLIANNTWEVLDKEEAKSTIVKTKWVYKIKKHLDGSIDKYKARLVAKGYSQTPGINVNETFASIVKHKTWRTLLAIAVELDLRVYHWDIATAFLNAPLEEEVYMETPEGFDFGHNKLLRLKKGLYGLQQASRQWYMDLTNTLKSLGLTKCNSDENLFVKYNDEKTKPVLAMGVWVDDMVIVCKRDSTFLGKLKSGLNQKYKVEDKGLISEFLGIKVTRGKDTIKIDQSDYVTTVLKRFNMEDCKVAPTPDVKGKKLSPRTNAVKKSKQWLSEALQIAS